MIDAYFDEEKEYPRMIKMLNEKTSTQTKEKYAMEIRQEKRLKQAYTEIDKISAERDEFIRTILLEFEDSADK